MALTNEEIEELKGKAKAIRETIIQMLVIAGSGHTAGSLAWRIFSPLFIFTF